MFGVEKSKRKESNDNNNIHHHSMYPCTLLKFSYINQRRNNRRKQNWLQIKQKIKLTSPTYGFLWNISLLYHSHWNLICTLVLVSFPLPFSKTLILYPIKPHSLKIFLLLFSKFKFKFPLLLYDNSKR